MGSDNERDRRRLVAAREDADVLSTESRALAAILTA